MGLFDRVMGQFIEVIEWVDDSPNTLVYRFPVYSKEIKMGAQLTVRESQAAVFVNEGKVADVFKPGRYELSTKNLPILTTLRSWPYAFNSPFKAEVYFFNMRQYTDLKWGSANPITVRDPELGAVRLRAFGIFAMRLSDPAKFYSQVSGTEGLFTVEGITGQLRGTIINRLSDMIAESSIPFVDLSRHLQELSQSGQERLKAEFESFGLDLTKFFIENISVPADVEKVIDRKASMNVVGDIGRYAQFQAADAIKDAAQNPGGVAGAGAGLGVGIGMGQMFADAMKATSASASCGKCAKPMPADAKFCPECGHGKAAACPKCKASLSSPAKFCPQCGQAL